MRRLLLSVLLIAACENATTLTSPGVSFSIVSGDGQTGAVGQPLASPLVIKAIDSRGRPQKNLQVSFLIVSGAGSANPASARTDQNGLAQTTWILGTSVAQPQVLEARASQSNTLLGSFTATPLPGPPGPLVIQAGDGQSAVHDTPVPIAPAVLVEDQYANPISGVSVTFAVTAGGGGVTGSPATSTADGIATLGSWTLGSTSGANTLSASAPGAPPVTFSATATAGPAARMVLFEGDNQTTTVLTPVPIRPAVRITDATGNPVEHFRPNFVVVNQWPGTVSNSTPESDANGVARVDSWTLSSVAADPQRLRVTASPMSDTVYFSATATSSAPYWLLFDNWQTGQTRLTNTAVAPPPKAVVIDRYNNRVSGTAVTFAVTEGGGSIASANPATTDANGYAPVTWILGPDPGANTLTATVAGIADPATLTLTAAPRPASASQSRVSAAPATLTASDGSSASTITVIARDDAGTGISGATVLLSATGLGNTLVQPGPTNAEGVATGTLHSTRIGTKVVTATIGTVTVSQTASILVTAAAPARIALFRGEPQSAGVGTPVFTPPAVIVSDAFHNVVSGATVTFAVATGGGSISGPNGIVTNQSGIAAVGGWVLGPEAGANTLTASVEGENVAGNPVTFTATGVTEFWTRLAPMPTHRQHLGAGAVAGRLYAIGGIPFASPLSGAGAPTALVQAYDPGTDSWTARSPMLTPRTSLGVGVLNGIVYAVGGWNGEPVAAVEAYDPATDTWTAKAPLPTPRYDLAVTVVDGVLYAIGGAKQVNCVPEDPYYPYCNNYVPVATVEAYDPVSDTWNSKADMPTPRQVFGAATVNGSIYVMGGQWAGVNDYLSSVEAYSPATDTWVTRASMPTGRFAHVVGVIDGIIFAAGGEVFNAGTAINEAYNPATDTWTTKVPLIEWRRGHAGAVLGGLFYVVGGSSSAASNWRLDLLDAYHP